ncbi:hypothetical protein J1N35_005820, partial [Gossypium stocksii]
KILEKWAHTPMWPTRMAHMAQIDLGRVDHTDWPKIPHVHVVHSCGPTLSCAPHSPIAQARVLHTASPAITRLSHAPVSCAHGLVRGPHGRVLHTAYHIGDHMLVWH